MKLTIENVLVGCILVLCCMVSGLVIQYNMIDEEEILDIKTLDYLASIENYIEQDIVLDVTNKSNPNIVYLKKRVFTKKEIKQDINLRIVALLENS